jgi:hypothetical protein
MSLAVAAVVAFTALWYFTRTRSLFTLSVRDGRVLVVRGRIPRGLLGDLRDVVAHAQLPSGSITAYAAEDGARLTCSRDVDEGTAQRLRNTFRLCPMSALRKAPAIAKPTLGQLLGVAWLAWLLDPTAHR